MEPLGNSSFRPLQDLLAQFASGNSALGTARDDDHDGNHNKLNEAVENEVRPSAISPQQTLNQRVLSSLNSVLASSQSSSIQNFAPSETFTPEGVASTILNAVNGFLASLGNQNLNDEQLSGFFNQVRQGVEQGANEAREILSSLGRLSDEVASEIDDTVVAVQQGIDQLEEGTIGGQGNALVVSSSQALSASYARSESGSLQIETQEGDLVTISFSRNQSAEILAYQSVQSGFAVQGFEQTTSASASLSFSVVGDLNEEELESISQLISKIDELTDEFFEGDLQEAFGKASELGIDAEQLASFSLSLSFEETVSIASASSQTTIAPASGAIPALGNESAPRLGAITPPGSRSATVGSAEQSLPAALLEELDDDEAEEATNFIGNLAELFDDDDAKEVFNEPAQAVASIFNSFLDEKLGNNSLIDALEQDSSNLLKSLVEQISNLVRVND